MSATKPFAIDKWLVYEAYQAVKANAGSAGVDKESIGDFEKDLKGNLYKIWNRMSSGSYFPPPVKAVAIPKKNGGERILGVPTVADRVAQTVVKRVIEPGIEAKFLPDSYGYRPGRSALDAVGVTRERCWKYSWVLEFDIKGLFDNIDHALLEKALEKHVECEWAMLYIRRWLTAPLQQADGTRVERTRGTPQGGVVSPVLANLFLHYTFDVWMTKHYPDNPWCRYADDGLVHCRTEQEAQALMAALDARFAQCALQMHPDKTKIVYCKESAGWAGRPRRCLRVILPGMTEPHCPHAIASAADLSLDAFISRWQDADGCELANYQLFITDLCQLLGVPAPDPARDDTRDNAYVFERRVTFRHGDGSESTGRIDCYKRSAYVLEAKKVRLGVGSKVFDDAMQRARGQAEGYARALPAEEGRPPFLIVIDVGRVIELYADFTRSGATYTPFPDPRSHRIRLADLADEAIRTRLRTLWLDPLALDPTRVSARVTREIAGHLAKIAKTLEGVGHHPELVAGFLTRCLFSMFAEDVGLLPKQEGKGAFSALLATLQANPQQFVPLLAALWREMDSGGFSVVLRATLPRFNGKLFKQPEVIALDRDQIGLLIEAANADWTQVEPAIFGTLLERALSTSERHALGAHYTPRAYVERLVLPTVVEPLRSDWRNVQAAALLLANEGRLDAARAEVDAFHHRLCQVRVLDPACGSANFLYVTLEHLKRLEGEVLDQLHAFGRAAGGSQQRLEAEGLTVDPHQFLGLELNPRAAAIAELVLWIGYLQWHFRTNGSGLPPQPILKDFRNIECRDAVLACDAVETVLDERGQPVSRWDGVTTKPHPVTGEPVPDENERLPLQRYLNPRQAEWPQADFIVGNPPFIGAGGMRAALGDGYVEALRKAWQAVPEWPTW
jgi:group II intron reverse transcriptase/maturase